MRRTLPFLVTLLTISAPLGAADLEPARDALRRHEYGRAAELLRTPAAGGDSEAAFILKRVSLFSQIPDEYLADLANLLEEVHASAGQALIQQGELGECMYVIVTGRVRVHVGDATLNVQEDRYVFGELALIDQEARSASVTALDSASFQTVSGASPALQ